MATTNVVQVHLVIHQQQEDLRISFPFDKQTDDIDSVVTDLIQTLGMTETDRSRLKPMVEAQITNAPSTFEPIAGGEQTNAEESSDDEAINDPQYRSLLEYQKREMQTLLARQFNEKRELALRIQNQALLMKQQAEQIANAPVNPTPPSTPANLTPSDGTVEDLIVF